MNKEMISQKIKAQGLLPLFYHEDPKVCIAVTKALYAAGVRCVEFTNRGLKAADNFGQLIKERNTTMKDLLLAIGTIKTSDEATRFIEAGADLLISPVFDDGVARVANAFNKLWIPGCMTPTEIHVAQQAGCTLVKLFPGNTLGTGFVEAIKPLFTGIDYVVTGGVDITEESIGSWFKAGVAGVGLGSKLISKEVLSKGNYDGLKETTEKVLAIIRKVRGE